MAQKRPPCNAVKTKRLSLRCPVMMVTIFLRLSTKKLFLAKKQRFWAQKGRLWAIGAKKRPAERPNDHLPENQSYPELPEDMGERSPRTDERDVPLPSTTTSSKLRRVDRWLTIRPGIKDSELVVFIIETSSNPGKEKS